MSTDKTESRLTNTARKVLLVHPEKWGKSNGLVFKTPQDLGLKEYGLKDNVKDIPLKIKIKRMTTKSLPIVYIDDTEVHLSLTAVIDDKILGEINYTNKPDICDEYSPSYKIGSHDQILMPTRFIVGFQDDDYFYKP